MARFGLNANSGTEYFVRVLTQLDLDNVKLTDRVKDLEFKANKAKDERDKKQWTESKTFQLLNKFSNSDGEFPDWEFQLQRFLRPYPGVEEWMDWLKNLDTEPTKEVVDEKSKELVDVDLAHFDEQLYGVLCLLCAGTSLMTVRNQRENYGMRGSASWFKLTREVAGKTGVRLERLADLVHNPKVISSYASALAQLEKWESQRIELEKLEEQGLSDLTKRTALKNMLPHDLIRDLERDKSLKTWEAA